MIKPSGVNVCVHMYMCGVCSIVRSVVIVLYVMVHAVYVLVVHWQYYSIRHSLPNQNTVECVAAWNQLTFGSRNFLIILHEIHCKFD